MWLVDSVMWGVIWGVYVCVVCIVLFKILECVETEILFLNIVHFLVIFIPKILIESYSISVVKLRGELSISVVRSIGNIIYTN